MRDRLQTQLFGPYFGSFSAHSYGYELSNDPKSVIKLLDFRFDPILGQPPSASADFSSLEPSPLAAFATAGYG